MSEPNVFALGSTEFLMRLGTERGVYVSVWRGVAGVEYLFRTSFTSLTSLSCYFDNVVAALGV